MFPRSFAVLCLCSLLLCGCSTSVSLKSVMISCDTGQPFDGYAQCIKDTYSQNGRRANSVEARIFYANLDTITEAYKKNRITNAQAKAMAYDAYLKVVPQPVRVID